MKTITEIELKKDEYETLCFYCNYDTRFNTYLATKDDVYDYLKDFVDEEISTDYVLFKKVA